MSKSYQTWKMLQPLILWMRNPRLREGRDLSPSHAGRCRHRPRVRAAGSPWVRGRRRLTVCTRDTSLHVPGSLCRESPTGVEEAGLRAGGCQSLGAPVGVRNKHTHCREPPPWLDTPGLQTSRLLHALGCGDCSACLVNGGSEEGRARPWPPWSQGPEPLFDEGRVRCRGGPPGQGTGGDQHQGALAPVLVRAPHSNV